MRNMPNNKKVKKAPKSGKSGNSNNKTTATSAGAAAAAAAKNASSSAASGGLSQPQLALLILLSLGFSRLMQIKSVHVAATTLTEAAAEEEQDVSSSSSSNKACIQHLGLEACADPAVQDALLYKFHTGMQTMALIMAVMLQCWNDERILERLTSTLAFCPLLLTGLVLVFSNSTHYYIAKNTLMKELLMGTVLFALMVPSSRKKLPFWPDDQRLHKSTAKSLQSLCCMTLAAMNAMEAGRWIWRGGLLRNNVEENWINNVAQDVLVAATPAKHHAVFPILALTCVDLLAKAALHAFVWFYFTEASRRSYLLSVATLQMVEYVHQVPILEPVLRQSKSMGVLSLSIGIFCAFCWIVPNISWKKKFS